jgi:hypothetical protein
MNHLRGAYQENKGFSSIQIGSLCILSDMLTFLLGTGGPSWRPKGPWPPTQLKFTQYHLVFTIFYHVKHKIFQVSPLNFYVMTFRPSYIDAQGPPVWA